MAPPRRVTIRTDSIALGRLLKLARVAATGGEAKQLIQRGQVTVDGAIERRRGRRILPGNRVQAADTLLIVERSG